MHSPLCFSSLLFVSKRLCPLIASRTQAQSQVTKLQTRLDTNLLKRLGELQAAAAQPELAGQAAGLEALQQDLGRAESALADVESRLAAVEARSEELSKEVRCVCVWSINYTFFQQERNPGREPLQTTIIVCGK
jgi:hypothetical protein